MKSSIVKDKISRYGYLVGIIIGISLIIPLIIVALIYNWINIRVMGLWVYYLPVLNACINFITSIALLWSIYAIKEMKDSKVHRKTMTFSIILGVCFLVSYVLYHASVDSVKYGDANHDYYLSGEELDSVGFLRIVYLFILLSHIFASFSVIPFVTFSFYYAITHQWDKHRNVVKYSYPIWLYVSISGVVVYLLLSPYYHY
ncbi:MAG: DUF420 domain-containing protein [Chitinophagaceae bacterium]|nr:DUF420 domain-containing protein [Chitinophagaceae bacterium]